MAEFQNTIDLLGDEAVTKALVERTITEFNDDVITKVGRYAFYACSDLTSVNMPNATIIDKNAFSGCRKVTNVDFPFVTSIGDNAFYNCTALASVNLPLADLGSASSNGFFVNCSSLKSIRLPLFSRLKGFKGCTSLEIVDTSNTTMIYGMCFGGCNSLRYLILRWSGGVCDLDSTSELKDTPFASGKAGGTLIVPRSSVDGYKTATNWSAIWGYGHNRFLALEDYTVDGTITGAIDWDKLNGGN